MLCWSYIALKWNAFYTKQSFVHNVRMQFSTKMPEVWSDIENRYRITLFCLSIYNHEVIYNNAVIDLTSPVCLQRIFILWKRNLTKLLGENCH